MKYTANYKWKELELNFNPKYDPLDFLRNNDVFDEEDLSEVNMQVILELMEQCYKDMLEKNYL